MEHFHIPTNDIRLHVAQTGPESGPLLILLHGFPDFWYGWRRQIPVMAEAGFRVWAPDQRGYNRSEKPQGIAAYRIQELGADVLGLADAAGEETFFLVGHDWGAAVGWWLAEHRPDRVRRFVPINVPHGSIMSRHLRRSPIQLIKSWYIFFFQIPWLPECLARLKKGWAAARALRASSRTGTFTDQELDRYRRAWTRPRAMRSMIHWYRAAARFRSVSDRSPRISVPTLLLWGARDRFLDRAMAQPSIELCEDGRLVMLEEATHWVHLEDPGKVNRAILDFFQEDLPD